MYWLLGCACGHDIKLLITLFSACATTLAVWAVLLRNAVHVKPPTGQAGNPHVCAVSCRESKQAWRHMYLRLGKLEQLPFMSAHKPAERRSAPRCMTLHYAGCGGRRSTLI